MGELLEPKTVRAVDVSVERPMQHGRSASHRAPGRSIARQVGVPR
jgi:hypothetical protein